MALPARAGRKKPPRHNGTKTEDFSLRQRWHLTYVLVKVRNGALTHKDVKN